MSEISTNRNRVMIESEATYGTDQVAVVLGNAATDIVYQDMKVADLDPTRVIFNASRVRASVSGVAHQSFDDVVAVSLEGSLTGKSGAAGTAPFYSSVLKAAGLKETIDSGVSVSYSPATVQQSAATIYNWQRNLEDANWRLETATGVRGALSIKWTQHEEPTYAFEGFGQYDDLMSDAAAYFDASNEVATLKDGSTAVALPRTGTEDLAQKSMLGCESMTISLGGTTMPVSAVEVKIPFTVDIVRTMNTTTVKVLLTMGDARVEGSFDLQDGASATDYVRDALKADTEAILIVNVGDGTDTINFTAAKAQIGQWSKGANGNVRSFSIPFFLNGTWSDLAGDNDFVLKYT